MKKHSYLRTMLAAFSLILCLSAFHSANGATVTVLSPNGGETFTAGTINTITWNSDVTGKLKIVLLKNGVQYAVIAPFVTNTGTYTWNVPATFQNGSDYKVKISSCTLTPVFDESDATFSIGGGSGTTITIVSPNGGETWTAGTPNTINWTSDVLGNVRITLLKNGALYTNIASSVSNTGSFVWNIPAGLAASADYTIRISKSTNAQIFDNSDATFSIISGGGTYLTLTAPNGGESFAAGTSTTITWNSDVTGKLRIVLLKNNVQVAVVAGFLPNTGSYTWNIPAYLLNGNDYSLRISCCANNTLIDESDAFFSITGGSGNTLTVTSPNGGEIWSIGDTATISWTSDVTTKLRILLMKGGVQVKILGGCLSNTGTFSWIISGTTIPGGDYTVKIMSCNYINITDESDATFTIIGPAPKSAIVSGAQDLQFSVYPNPANGVINISSEKEISHISISNNTGQSVLEEDLLSTQAQLNIDNLTPGIYFLKIQGEGYVNTKRLIVK
jgi:hypothetical protein